MQHCTHLFEKNNILLKLMIIFKIQKKNIF